MTQTDRDIWQHLLTQKPTKETWRAIISHLRDNDPQSDEPGFVDQLHKALMPWPAWVRYLELPRYIEFPYPTLIGELYVNVKRWTDLAVTTALPEFTQIQSLSLNIPLECCEDFPVHILSPFPQLTQCAVWAGHPDLAIEDPFVARNAFWALQNATAGLFQAHPPLQSIALHLSAEIDFFEEQLPLEASATRQRNEPWHTEERWEQDIAQWQYKKDGNYHDHDDDDW